MNTLTPPSPSPDLHLTHPSPHENQKIWDLISKPWRDALTPSQFLQECTHLLTVPLAANGGMTCWILVSQDSVPDHREILASCESFKKRALVSNVKSDSKGGVEMEVEDVIIHGIASVFCDPRYRGNGYAKVMMRKLGAVLEGWQVRDGEGNGDEKGERCVGSILYSDIGGRYYSDLGWRVVDNNTHLEFPALQTPLSNIVKILHAEDLKQLCLEDEIMIRKKMARPSTTQGKRMIIIPHHEHMLWHHAKEEFVSNTLFNKIPLQKGVLVGSPGKRIWAIWTHRFYHNPEPVPSGNVLYILRLVIEDPEQDNEELKDQLKMVFQAAQNEAKTWNLDVVKLWDPQPRVQRLMRRMGVEYAIIERKKNGIASLMWYGEEDGGRVEWVANEKYAWC